MQDCVLGKYPPYFIVTHKQSLVIDWIFTSQNNNCIVVEKHERTFYSNVDKRTDDISSSAEMETNILRKKEKMFELLWNPYRFFKTHSMFSAFLQ